MQRRNFLKTSAMIGSGLITGAYGLPIVNAQQSENGTNKPTHINLGGYGPATSSFSQGLKLIGDRLESRFGEEMEVRYVYNILDLGYEAAGDLTWLVDSGVLSLAYLTILVLSWMYAILWSIAFFAIAAFTYGKLNAKILGGILMLVAIWGWLPAVYLSVDAVIP